MLQQLRGNIVASKYKGGLYRIILSEDGSQVTPSSDPAIFLGGDNSLAITQAPNGVIIDARYVSSKLYYYEPRETSYSSMNILSVFPRRGGEAGGSVLHIYGANFPTSQSPVVAVGGKRCRSAKRVSDKEVTCILPGGSRGTTVDVTVRFGDTIESTLTKGYRYVRGFEDSC